MPGSGTPTPKMNIATFKDTDDFDFNDVNSFLAIIDDLGMPDVVTSATRPTTDLRNGRLIYETDTQGLLRYDSSVPAWKYIWRSGWVTGGITWKNGPSGAVLGIGSGSLNSRWKQMGYDVEAQFEMARTADSSVGTGYWIFDLPVAAAYPQGIMGTATIFTAGVQRVALPSLLNGSTMALYTTNDQARVGNNTPGVWAAGDSVNFSIKYRAAAVA